jgi:hypothetical protein
LARRGNWHRGEATIALRRRDAFRAAADGSAACSASSYVVLGHVGAHDAPVTLNFPIVIRTLVEPIGNSDLRVDRAGTHGDAGQFTICNNLFETKLAVAEHGDESNEHDDLLGEDLPG